jgi:hypothetical protein
VTLVLPLPALAAKEALVADKVKVQRVVALAGPA